MIETILQIKDRILDNAIIFNLVRSMTDSRNLILDMIKEELNAAANEKILDVGCGLGNFSEVTHGYYTGIDMNTSFIKFAKKHYGNNNKIFMAMDAKKLNFKDKSFDKSLFISMLHFFSDNDNEKVLKEIMRVTKKFLIVLDLIPTERPHVNFLYKMNRGHYIRALDKQLRLIRKYFKIERYSIHEESMFNYSLIVCKPLK